MRFANFMNVLTWLAVIANLVGVIVCLYFFIEFAFNSIANKANNRTWLDSSIPFLFLIGGVVWGRFSWNAFKTARSYNNGDEFKSISRVSPKANVAKIYKQTEAVEAYLRSKFAVLIKHKVISQDEFQNANIEKSLSVDEWEADFYSVSSIIHQLFADNPQLFANLYCRTEQVEVGKEDYVHLITKFSVMLDLEEQPKNIRIEYGKNLSILHFDYAGEAHSFRGDFPAKYLAWDIIPEIVRLLESKGSERRLFSISTDMQFIVTALKANKMDALNEDFCDEGMDEFERFKFFA